jgi:hypothetical protein
VGHSARSEKFELPRILLKELAHSLTKAENYIAVTSAEKRRQARVLGLANGSSLDNIVPKNAHDT